MNTPRRGIRRAFVALVCLAPCACPSPRSGEAPAPDAGPTTTAATSSPAVPAGKRLVDHVALHAQCLLSTIKTPPNVVSNNWQDVGEVEVAGKRYGWLIIDQSAADVPLADANSYLWSAQVGLLNRGLNASQGLCLKEWDDARADTLLTMFVRITGSATHGTYAIVGMRADQERQQGQILRNVDAAEARKQAVKLTTASVAGKITVITAPTAWFEAAR